VDALYEANEDLRKGQGALTPHVLPSRDAMIGIVGDLSAALFPRYNGGADLSDEGVRFYMGRCLDAGLGSLHEQVRRGLVLKCLDGDCAACTRRADEVMAAFVARLPAMRVLLGKDVMAAYEGDPAATSTDEAVFCYPGIVAMIHHRIAHELSVLGAPLIPRIIAELAHSTTGIDIHPGATIGGSFFIDHGTGVVIGETCRIGDRVRIYQGVTLGAKSFPTDDQGRLRKGIPRHPIVEDDVVIYAGATILGRITIGRGSSIGGNVWLVRSVPPGSRVAQAEARQELFEGGLGI
jgi:serine O-acetyltransferase